MANYTHALWRRSIFLSLVLSGLLLGAGYVLAYRTPFRYEMPLDGATGFLIDGLTPTEWNNLTPIRWTLPWTELRLPAFGRTVYRLNMSFHTPPMATVRTFDITADGRWVARVKLVPGWQSISLILPPTTITPHLRLQTEPPLHAPNRTLGVAVERLGLEQLAPAVTPIPVLRQLLLIGLLVTAIVGIASAGPRAVACAAPLLIAVLLPLLAWQRFIMLLLLPPLALTLGIGVVFALAVRVLSRFTVRPSEKRCLAGLRLIIVGLFVARLVGMQYPAFREIDHLARVHHIQRIAQGQSSKVEAELNNQYEWGRNVQVPYSLWAYYPFVPLANIVSTDRLKLIVEATTALLEATIPLLLFALVIGSGETVKTAWWSAATYGALPIGFLYYHDGSFPTIIGLWLSVITLVCLQRLSQRPGWRRWLLTVASIAGSMLLYITQLGFEPLVVGCYGVALWVGGDARLRRAAQWTIGALLTAIVLALALYYGPILPHMVLVTVPTLVQTIQQRGSVGATGSALPGPLVGSFPLQAWGHFRVIGLVAAAGGLVLAVRKRLWLGYLGLAYAGFTVLTVVVDTRVGLWNKHLYFALPGVALLAGVAFAWLERRSKAGALLARTCLTLLLLASLHAWIVRVLFYHWSLATL